MQIRVLKHVTDIPFRDTGSYEIKFPDGRQSVYFYWDDNPGRRSITQAMSSEEAERKAKDLARTEQDKLDGEDEDARSRTASSQFEFSSPALTSPRRSNSLIAAALVGWRSRNQKSSIARLSSPATSTTRRYCRPF
jgi:hypothetical protein